MSYRLLALPLFTIPFIALPSLAYSSTELDSMVVTASRLDSSSTLAANITVITKEDIANSPLRTLPELLSTFAGINTTSFNSHGATGKIDIRGFGATATQNTLILLDGRRLNDIDLSNINFSSIPYENIERIEIIRGSGAILYGDGATGGVINIITQSPNKSKSYSKVSVTAGSENHRVVNAFTSINNDLFGLTANINSTRDDGYRDNNEYEQTSGQIDFRLPINGDDLYLKVGRYINDLEYPGVRNYRPNEIVTDFGPPFGVFVTPVDLSLINDRKGTDTPNDEARENVNFYNMGYTANLSNQTQLIIDGGYRNKDVAADFPQSYTTFVNTEHSVYSFTPRLLNTSELSFGSLSSIVGMDWYQHDYDSVSDRSTRKIDQKNQSFYWQSSLSIHDETYITAGIRTDNVSFDGQNLTTSTQLNKDERENSYELGIKQLLDEKWSIYARIGKSARFGNVDEQIAVFGTITDLKPQTAQTHEVGLGYSSNIIESNISLFHQNLTDEIRYNPISGANENLDNTRRKGVEVSTSISINEWIQLNGNYTYLSAKFREGTLSGNNLPLIPKNTYNIGLVTSLPNEFKSSINWNHVSETYFANDLDNNFGLKIPSYQTVNFRLSKQVEKLELSLSVNNIFDEKYYNYGVNGSPANGNFNAYPMAERTVYFSASYQFD